jgi:hypothetical protein
MMALILFAYFLTYILYTLCDLWIVVFLQNNCIICWFYLQSLTWLVQKLTRDFGFETSSVNEEHKHQTTPTSGNYFRMSQKYITTHNNNSWQCQMLGYLEWKHDGLNFVRLFFDLYTVYTVWPLNCSISCYCQNVRDTN